MSSLSNQSPALVSYRRASLALILVNIIWGLSFPIMKSLNLLVDEHFQVDGVNASTAYRMASSAWVIGLRFGLALILFAVIFRSTMLRLKRAHWIAGGAIGMLFFGGLMLQVSGLSTIPASRSGFLTSLSVVWTPILTTILQRKPPRKIFLFAAGLSVVGVATLTGLVRMDGWHLQWAPDGPSRWRTGDTLTLISVLFFSGQIVLLDWFGKRLDSLALTPPMFATTTGLAFLFFAGCQSLGTESPLQMSQEAWNQLLGQPSFVSVIVFLAIFPSLIAFSLMNRFQPSVSATQASVLYTLEPLAASLWAMFIPGLLLTLGVVGYANETPTKELVIGGLILILANLLAMRPSADESLTPLQ